MTYIHGGFDLMMKQISLRLEEKQLEELKHVADICERDYSSIIREGIDEMLKKIKSVPWYRLNDAPLMDPEEEAEILNEINSLTPEDLDIVETEVWRR